MTLKNYFFCLVLLGISWTVNAQQEGKTRSLILEGGMNVQKSLETRFTARLHSHWGYHTTIGFEGKSEKIIHHFSLNFAQNISRKFGAPDFNNLYPQVKYAHLRKTKISNSYVGAFADMGALLSFPRGRWDGNNEISYTIWSSMGAMGKWEKAIPIFSTKALHLRLDASFPLVGYVIRPAYGAPYPANFLEEGRFDFKRTGMGKYILTTGKIRTVNTFTNIKTKVTLVMPFGKKAHEWGINYSWNFFKVGGNQSNTMAIHHLSILTKINF